MSRSALIVEEFDRFFREEAPLADGEGILVAFSGGPDSTCLLKGLVELRERRAIRLAAAHLDHALDDDSGRRAEQFAARSLLAKGYRIRHTNWRCGKKELDLITYYQKELVIVEVKSRTGGVHHNLGEVVDQRKQRNIILATEAYIRLFNLHYPTRFDIISVIYDGYIADIQHIENAFFPTAE